MRDLYGLEKEKYEELLSFINKLCLHELRRTELIGKVDLLVEALIGSSKSTAERILDRYLYHRED